MRKKEIAKKLGITILACMLALSGAVPMVSRADVNQAADEPSDAVSHPLDSNAQQPVTKDQDPIADEPQYDPPAEDEGTSGSQDQTKNQMPEDLSGLELTTKTQKKEYKTKEGRIYKQISFEYPVAQADSEAAQTFNAFYKKLRTKWKKAALEDLKEAKEVVAQIDDPERYYTDEVICEITSIDENYISVLQSGYVYTMGAHGTPYRYTYIFDAKTGKKVSAANLLGMTKKQLNNKVRSLFLKKFDKTAGKENHPFYEDRTNVKTTLDKMDFNANLYYLKNGKIRFYADPYAVGPYAAGFIEVAVKLNIISCR